MKKGYDFYDLRMSYGDWFLLCKLGANLHPIVFTELLQELIEKFSDDEEAKSLTKENSIEDKKVKSNTCINLA